MKTIEAQDLYGCDDQCALRRAARGWFAEAAGALAVMVCSGIGLAGFRPTTMAGVAAIILGASILIESGAFAAGFRGLVSRYRDEGRAMEWGGVIVAELVGGLAGSVLGILALLGIATPIMLVIAVLIFGATFLFTSMVSLESGLQALGGLGAFVLGLLAVSGIAPLTSILLALLALGLAGLASGAVTGSRILHSRR